MTSLMKERDGDMLFPMGEACRLFSLGAVSIGPDAASLARFRLG
jgi:hypothetical protein